MMMLILCLLWMKSHSSRSTISSSFESMDWVQDSRASSSSTVRVLLGVEAARPEALETYFWKVSDPR